MTVVLAALLISILLWGILGGTRSASAAEAKRVRHLAGIGNHLGGESDGKSKAWGDALGARIELELATRGAGSSAEYWTHIDVEIPRAYPLAMHLRRHVGSDRRVIARGDMVDVEVGDARFDADFLVEAAPADVVRALLDADARALISGYARPELETVERADGRRVLRLALHGWIEELEALRAPLSMMVRLGSSVRAVFAAVEAESPEMIASVPYRPERDGQASRDAQVAREAEVERVRASRGRRAASAEATVVLVMIVVAATMLAAFLILIR